MEQAPGGEGEFSLNTIDQMVNSVRYLLREGATQGYIAPGTVDALGTVDSVKPPKERKALRTVIEREDVRAICTAPDRSPAGLMHRALLP